MKELPDRDWFSAVGVCIVLEVSTATFSRMLADGRFQPFEGKQGQRHLWSFATVASYCINQLTAEQQRLFNMMDAIEDLHESRAKRATGAALAVQNEEELSRLRRKMLADETWDEMHRLAKGTYGGRDIREWLRTFPYVYPDHPTLEPAINDKLLDKLRVALKAWRSTNH